MTEDFDFAVIGAGMAGASIAAELSRTYRVAVLEREDQPGYHATGRSAAVYSGTYGNAAVRALSGASKCFFLSGTEGSAPFATRRPLLYIAKESQLADLEAFAELPDVNAATQRLSADVACKRVSLLRRDYVAAALIEPEAYDLDVHAVHLFFLQTLRARGGKLYCSQPIKEVVRHSGGWTIPLGSTNIRAQVLINAAGAWGDIVAEMAGVKPVGLQPMQRTVVLVDAPPSTATTHWPTVFDIEEQFYFKPDLGRILMSPADETPSAPCDAAPDEIDVATAIDRVQQAADIPVKRIAHKWAGLRTFAPDRSPVVGYDDETPDFFWLVGQGGYGIQMAPALARLAAALAARRSPPPDIVERGLEISQICRSRFSASL